LVKKVPTEGVSEWFHKMPLQHWAYNIGNQVSFYISVIFLLIPARKNRGY